MKLTEQNWESRGDRKLLKPILEKRRRDRINQSLEVLRTLLLEATEDERFRNPKAEKAEILKRTVEFLKLQPLSDDALQEEQKQQRYHSGYRECLLHASEFIRENTKLGTEKRSSLLEQIQRIPQTPQDNLPEKERLGGSPALSSPTQAFRRIARGHLAQRGILHASPLSGTPQTLQNPSTSSPQGESPHYQHPSTSSLQGEPPHTRHQTPTHPERGVRCKPDTESRGSPCQDTPSVPPSTTVWRPWP